MTLLDSARPLTVAEPGGRRPVYAPNFLPSMDLPRLSPPWHASRSAMARRNADRLPRTTSLYDYRATTPPPFTAHSQARQNQSSAPRVALPFRPVLDWRVMQEEAIRWRQNAERERDALQRVQYRIAAYAAAERSPRGSRAGERPSKRQPSAGTRRKAGRLVAYTDPFVRVDPQLSEAEAHQLAVLGSRSEMQRQEAEEMRRALSAPALSPTLGFAGGEQHGDTPYVMRSGCGGLSRERALRAPLV